MNKNTILVTLCLKLPRDTTYNYVNCCKEWSESYLKHTPYNQLIITNVPEEFDSNNRVTIEKYELTDHDKTITPKTRDDIGKDFDYTHKLVAINIAYEKGYDVVYWMDCDVFTDGWDLDSYNRVIEDESCDLWTAYPTSDTNKVLCNAITPFLELPRSVPPKWDVNGEYCYITSIREDRLIFSNRAALKDMVDLMMGWIPTMSLSERCTSWSDGKLISCAVEACNATVRMVPRDYEFTQYEKGCNRGIGDIRDREWLPL